MARRKQNTSVGDAARVSLATVIFGFTAMILVWIVGAAVVVAYRHGAPYEGDLWLVFWISLVPWAIMLLQVLHTATRGIESAFPTPNLPAPTGELDYKLEQVPLWLDGQPKLNGAYVIDHMHFIRRVCETYDWTQRTWAGGNGKSPMVMPSGVECDREYHRRLVTTLTNRGFIMGYKPRSTGKLLCRHPEQIIEHLGLYRLLRGHQREY